MKVVRALLVLFVAIGLFGNAPSAFATEVRIAVQPIPLYAPLFVAKANHWLDEEFAKIDKVTTIKWSVFPAGAPINESFAAGQQDIGLLGDTPATIGRAAGIETRVIGHSASGPRILALIVAKDSAITSPEQLKRRKVAVTKASISEHLLSLVLQKYGLSLKDVEQINLPNAEIPSAIITGAVDAGGVWEPILTKYESQGAVKVLADGTGLKTAVQFILASDSFLKDHREYAKAFLRVYARGAEFVKANPKEASNLITADVNLPPDLAEKVISKLDFNPVISDADIVELKQTEGYLSGVGLTRKRVDVDAWLDRSLASEAGLK